MFIIKTNTETDSYIGGLPVVPKGTSLPKSESGIPLTFFFTVKLPKNHKFFGYTLSFFSATGEFDENLSIPEMITTELKNAIIPSGFLKQYQKLFKVFFFKSETATTLEEVSNIKLQHLDFSDQETGDVFGWAGTSPKWVLEDESPSSYEGQPISFLLQVKNEQTFEILDTAPPQKEINIFGGEKDRKKRNYFFFNENEVFFFGRPSEKPDDNVYIITQCE
ncbi:hypothetical protein [Pseudomonas koreensis]|uniref:DUF1963 domain-containing protein n=1 Tax=Pseudomonas koreensis TaxID=198620 RepID=A0A9X3B5S7_9PSED|nr:hypothetical protein [Pseudomonas koreensis]MCU7251612.1 hypothetical protein [Pseudomonas koreensis]